MSRTSERFDHGQLRDSGHRGPPQRLEKRSRSPSPIAGGGDGNYGRMKARRNESPPTADSRSSRRDSRRGSPRNNLSSGDSKLKRRRSPTPEPRNRGSGNSSGRRDREKPRRSRSRSYSPGENVASPGMRQQVLSHGMNVELSEQEEEERMRRMMGFSSFDSTKGKQHADVGEAQIAVRRRYRQYMNRKGGFNRPLDPIK